MQICSRAPLRISFAGGGTDVEPYLSNYGGLVLSTTIDKYVYATLRANRQPWISVRYLDYDKATKFDVNVQLQYTGEIDLVKAVLHRVPGMEGGEGMDVVLRSDVRPGTGLGASSAMAVALVALFKHWLKLPLLAQEAAEIAYQAERIDAGSQGGKQDQYATAFGGFNLIDFHKERTTVHPLTIKPSTIHELQGNLLLCNTGVTRLSTDIIAAQVKHVENRQEEVLHAMDALKQIALALNETLLCGRLDDFGALLHEAWLNKQQMATQITNPHLDEIYATGRKYGALGGKISGAGGGGYMFFYCPSHRKLVIAEQLERLGAHIEGFSFVPHGVQAWIIR